MNLDCRERSEIFDRCADSRAIIKIRNNLKTDAHLMRPHNQVFYQFPVRWQEYKYLVDKMSAHDPIQIINVAYCFSSVPSAIGKGKVLRSCMFTAPIEKSFYCISWQPMFHMFVKHLC